MEVARPVRRCGPGRRALAKAVNRVPARSLLGIDLHRRRSVIVRKNADGEVLSKVHIDNDPMALATAVSAAGPKPEVVLLLGCRCPG